MKNTKYFYILSFMFSFLLLTTSVSVFSMHDTKKLICPHAKKYYVLLNDYRGLYFEVAPAEIWDDSEKKCLYTFDTLCFYVLLGGKSERPMVVFIGRTKNPLYRRCGCDIVIFDLVNKRIVEEYENCLDQNWNGMARIKLDYSDRFLLITQREFPDKGINHCVQIIFDLYEGQEIERTLHGKDDFYKGKYESLFSKKNKSIICKHFGEWDDQRQRFVGEDDYFILIGGKQLQNKLLGMQKEKQKEKKDNFKDLKICCQYASKAEAEFHKK